VSRSILAGVDGCRSGWICVRQVDDGAIDAEIFTSFRQLLRHLENASIIAVDIPIGLPTANDRLCDKLARQLLRAPRASSVFPVPVWAAIYEHDYSAACAKHRAADGRALSKQAFAIRPKILEVNELIRSDIVLQDRVREVHPEVCFAVWNNGLAMRHRKTDAAGAAERERLIDQVWPGERNRMAKRLGRSGYQPDDLNDAFAALWTATRIIGGRARTLGAPISDQYGIKMELWA
jgi:predicted RNase H-like nuclease